MPSDRSPNEKQKAPELYSAMDEPANERSLPGLASGDSSSPKKSKVTQSKQSIRLFRLFFLVLGCVLVSSLTVLFTTTVYQRALVSKSISFSDLMDFDRQMFLGDHRPESIAGVHFERAKYLWQNGEVESAFQDMTKAASLVQSEPQYHEYRAWMLYDMRRYQEAVSDFERSLKLSSALSDQSRLYYGIARSFERLGDLSKEEQVLNKSTTKCGDWYSYKRRAEFLIRRGSFEEGLLDYQRASDLLETKNSIAARDNLSPDFLSELQLAAVRGNILANLNKYRRAFVDSDAQLAMDKQGFYYPLQDLRARLLLHLKGPANALEHWERVLVATVVPIDKVRILLRQAELHRQLKDYQAERTDHDESLAILSELVKSNPKDSWPLQMRGEYFEEMSAYNQAISDYERGLAIDMNFKRDCLLVGTWRCMLKLKKYDAVVSDAHNFAKNLPYSSIPYWVLSSASLDKGHLQAALTFSEKALDNWSGRSLTLWRAGRLHPSERYVDDGDIFALRARIYRELGQISASELNERVSTALGCDGVYIGERL